MISDICYYKLEHLPFEIRKLHGARKDTPLRLDCTKFYDPEGYFPFKDYKTKKGIMHFRRMPTESLNFNRDRKADIQLLNKDNLSSLFYEGNHEYCYGNAHYTNDGYLFTCNDDYSEIEIFVLAGQRWKIHEHYEKFLDGKYDFEFQSIRDKAETFFEYLDSKYQSVTNSESC